MTRDEIKQYLNPKNSIDLNSIRLHKAHQKRLGVLTEACGILAEEIRLGLENIDDALAQNTPELAYARDMTNELSLHVLGDLLATQAIALNMLVYDTSQIIRTPSGSLKVDLSAVDVAQRFIDITYDKESLHNWCIEFTSKRD